MPSEDLPDLLRLMIEVLDKHSSYVDSNYSEAMVVAGAIPGDGRKNERGIA